MRSRQKQRSGNILLGGAEVPESDKLKAMKETVSEKDAEVKELKTTVKELEKTDAGKETLAVKEYETKIAELEKIISETPAAEEYEIPIQQLTEQVENLSAELGEKNKQLEELLNQVPVPGSDPAAVEAIEKFEAEVAVLQSQRTELDKELEKLKKQVISSNKKLKDAAQMLRESDAKQKELQAQIDTLTEQAAVT